MRAMFVRRRAWYLWVFSSFLAIMGIGCWIFGFPYPYYANNYNLYRFGKQLQNLKMPIGTQRIGKEYAEFGNLLGNSNKGDYIAAQLIVSAQPQEKLESFINQVSFDSAERTSDWWNNARKLTIPDKKKLYLIPISGVDFSKDGQSFDALFEPEGKILVSAKTFALSKDSINVIQHNGGKIFLLLAADTQYVPDDFRCW